MDSATNPLYLSIIFVVGACLGSFATALIHRLPSGASWFLQSEKGQEIVSRSSCPTCGHKLSILDLVPLLSWLLLRGKCRYCRANIPCQYLLVELFVAVAAAALFVLIGPKLGFIPVLLALPFLSVLIVTNVRTSENYWLPSLAVFVLGLISCLVDFKGISDVIAAMTLSVVMGIAALLTLEWQSVRYGFAKEGLFLLGAGFFVGLSGLPLFLLLTAPLIVFGVIFCVVTGRKNMDFFPSIYAIALIFHLFLTGIGFDSRAVYWPLAG